MTTKVVINNCFGGFGLSHRCLELYKERTDKVDDEKFSEYDIERTDPILIELIEAHGSRTMSGSCADLFISEIPDKYKHWYIHEYDGSEHIVASETEIKHF